MFYFQLFVAIIRMFQSKIYFQLFVIVQWSPSQSYAADYNSSDCSIRVVEMYNKIILFMHSLRDMECLDLWTTIGL